MILYHGTSGIYLQQIRKHGILPPIETNITNEKRKINLDIVFLTDQYNYALGYAIRAANKVGGAPIVIETSIEAELERKGKVTQYKCKYVPTNYIDKVHIISDYKPEEAYEIFKLPLRL